MNVLSEKHSTITAVANKLAKYIVLGGSLGGPVGVARHGRGGGRRSRRRRRRRGLHLHRRLGDRLGSGDRGPHLTRSSAVDLQQYRGTLSIAATGLVYGNAGK